jgi:hypothetical protein
LFTNGITDPIAQAEADNRRVWALNLRNKCRGIRINVDEYMFNPDGTNTLININSLPQNFTTINNFYRKSGIMAGIKHFMNIHSGYNNVFLHFVNHDITLFHEILHWYHILRNSYRYLLELNHNKKNM